MKLEFSIGAPQYPVLNAFMGTNARVSAIMGPLGSGKTYGCAQRILRHMSEQKPNGLGVRPTRWCVVRNTYPDLFSTTHKDFMEVFDGLGEMVKSSLEPPHFNAKFVLPDKTVVESEVIFLALDRDDAVKKLRGTQVTGFWFNELKELVKPVIDMADLRHGRYPTEVAGGVDCTWHGMMGDLNACDEDHWYYKLAEEDCPRGWEFYKQPGGVYADGKLPNGKTRWVVNHDAENLANLPDRYYEDGLQGKSEDWISVNLANEYGFTTDGKPVHPEYVDSVHCIPEYEVDRKGALILGVDFGRTPAAAIIQFNQGMGRYIAFDELVTHDMSAALFGPELKRFLDHNYSGMPIEAWGDPAGDSAGQTVETTPIQILRAAGIPVRPCATNQTILRRAAVANPLTRNCMDGRPALLIAAKAKMLRKGLLGGFAFRRMKVAGEERFTELPDKSIYSHVCFVAGTKVSTPTGRKPIESLRVGDEVLTPLGPKRIVAAFHRDALTIEVTKGVRCTLDHPFLDRSGRWVSAADIDYVSNIVREGESKWTQLLCLRRAQRRQSFQSFCSRASATIAGATATIARTFNMAASACIEMSGSTQTATYPMTTASITSTATPPITTYRTSGACRRLNTHRCTREHQPVGTGRGSSWLSTHDLDSCGGWRRILTRCASSFTSTLRSLSRVSSAGLPPRPITTTRAERSGAQRDATAQPSARAVVYNIEVADAHSYYAEGLLVSNCEALEYACLGSGEGRAALQPTRVDRLRRGRRQTTALM